VQDEQFRWAHEGMTSTDLAQGIRGDILSARVTVGSAIPTRRALSAATGMSQHAVNRAYAELSAARLVISTRGAGSLAAQVEPIPAELIDAANLLASLARSFDVSPADVKALLASAINSGTSRAPISGETEWDGDPEGWFEMLSEDKT
jgi:DNA-binding transcriptional regulator YhcF (GntR family)